MNLVLKIVLGYLVCTLIFMWIVEYGIYAYARNVKNGEAKESILVKFDKIFASSKATRIIVYLMWPYFVVWTIKYAITRKK